MNATFSGLRRVHFPEISPFKHAADRSIEVRLVRPVARGTGAPPFLMKGGAITNLHPPMSHIKEIVKIIILQSQSND